MPVYSDGGELPPAALVEALPEFPESVFGASSDTVADELAALATRLDTALELYGTAAAMRTLATEPEPVNTALRRLADAVARLEAGLDARTAAWGADAMEHVQGQVRQVRDQAWALRHDRMNAAVRAGELTPAGWTGRSVTSYTAVSAVLDAIDRLEVRGRDSAGLTIWVELDPADRETVGDPARQDPQFRNRSVVGTAHGACFAYKHAAIIGRLGDNTRHLRDTIRADADLHRLLALPSSAVTVLAHTRWASVGRTSEANAHPVDSRDAAGTLTGRYAIAVANGDVDNYLALQGSCGYVPDDTGVTTDSKLIPLLLSRELAAGRTPDAAMVAALSACDGSVAIAAQCDAEQGEVLLAAKGSGQSLYVGFAPSGYFVASEVYGLVGVTSWFAKVDGQLWPEATEPGTVVRLNRAGAGRQAEVERWDGEGTVRPLAEAEVRLAEVTTHDLTLGDFEHYLEKEIFEAASSFRKTLRGRIATDDAGRPSVNLPNSSVPEELRRRLLAGELRQIVVLGQGTAAVACQGIANTMQSMIGDDLPVRAYPATEFSAWWLRADMADSCVVAVSQSGSTTDTNRAVDLARERGALVVSIINRRDSDLAEKSDGILYTSDGRDVELSVASTKAFYAQVAAGALLGAELARALGQLAPAREESLLRGLLRIPDQLEALHKVNERIAKTAREVAAAYPYWAVVGSGPNRVAAAEIRIKLSELCYKTISSDAVEDKKHIDLSAEALVVVCVAGAPPAQMSDLIKEVEILNAHRNRAVVVCDEGTEYLWPTDSLVPVPRAHPDLAWIMATAAGHLFAYHAARAIDATADDVRLALAGLEAAVDRGVAAAQPLPIEVLRLVQQLLAAAGRGELRGVLSSQTAVALAAIAYQSDPVGPAEARVVLTAALDELARPIDTVKHQAKTVTVGTSRGDSDLYDNEIIRALSAAGTDPVDLTFPVLDVIRAHARVVARPTGVTRYRLTHDGAGGDQLTVLTKTGVAEGLASRADAGAALTGSKRRVAEIRVPRLVRGRADDRIVLIVPEHLAGDVAALSVVHVELRDSCPISDLRAAMDSVGERMAEIIAAVSETRPGFVPEQLQVLPAAVVLLADMESLTRALPIG
ncbi:SIS domain-containing protein [Actinophytocola sediminis]